ncbi:tetratricopeptide repeat protein [Sorangium sp. So ce315]|uniref:hypothetical protein n=1 Tax=Sorangium sp. So ce315 TaxID=3133299 RepID=UPI003F6446D8
MPARSRSEREAALASTQEAVEQYRKLAATQPAAFLPDLAMSLNNLGLMQSELGQCEAALASTQEAVEQYRKLAAGQDAAFLPHLVTSLNNLGAIQSELGQREGALASTQEAVDIGHGVELLIPSGAKDHVEKMQFRMPQSLSSAEAYLYGAGTHMHYVGTDMNVALEPEQGAAGRAGEMCFAALTYLTKNE